MPTARRLRNAQRIMTTFIFDGTFEGLLTSIFEYYERKPGKVELVATHYYEPKLIGETLEITNDEAKAKRVWAGLKKKLSPDWQLRFYKSFLAETPEIFTHLFDFARYVFDNPTRGGAESSGAKGAEADYGHPAVIAIAQMDKSVNREKHRMKAFIRFQETADGIFYAPIEPDYNVLPLIASFFRNRYADQKWIIYDLKRHYGLFYDLYDLEEIRLGHRPELKAGTTFLAQELTHDQEGLYGMLWNDYFRSTNIPARKNRKLHIRQVPKRYWKYLTEKQPMEALFFIAIVPPKEIADAVTAIKQDFADRFESRKSLRVMPHITLKAPFKVFENEADSVLKWFADLEMDTAPFEIALDGFGAFDNNENPVIFVKPGISAGLTGVQKELADKLSAGFPKAMASADRHFHPHMTVAYRDLKREQFEKAWREYETKPFGAAFTAGHFHLLRHDGTKWNIVATKALR